MSATGTQIMTKMLVKRFDAVALTLGLANSNMSFAKLIDEHTVCSLALMLTYTTISLSKKIINLLFISLSITKEADKQTSNHFWIFEAAMNLT